MTGMTSIYKLFDTRYPDVCLYVGRTKQPLKKRLGGHKSENNVYSIKNYSGKEYVDIALIEYIEPHDFIGCKELKYIRELNPVYNFQTSSNHIEFIKNNSRRLDIQPQKLNAL